MVVNRQRRGIRGSCPARGVLLLLLALPVSVRAVDSTAVFPDTQRYWSGSAVWHPWLQVYEKYDTAIVWAHFPEMDADRFRGWCRFNLSPLADTSTILGATLRFYVSFSDTNVQTEVRLLTSDPIPAGPEVIYDEAGSGTLVGSESVSQSGWNSIVLNSDGLLALQQSLARDWVALGWDYPGTWHAFVEATGWPGPERPSIRLDCRPGAIAEQNSTPARDCGLTVAPNPATTRTSITLSLSEPCKVSLNLYDAVGTLARSIAECRRPAGAAEFELAVGALPRGVYVLRLCAGRQVTTRRLVVE